MSLKETVIFEIPSVVAVRQRVLNQDGTSDTHRKRQVVKKNPLNLEYFLTHFFNFIGSYTMNIYTRRSVGNMCIL
jgi:hypothetical protein